MVKALVSGEDVLAVVTDHLDHVHDAAIRLGCSPAAAREIAGDAGPGLVSDLLVRPETVGDLVGGLFGRCRDSAARIRRGEAATPAPDIPVPVDDAEARACAEALSTLPERRRLGLLLIDSYGVTLAQAAVALGLDAAETARTVALGRAALVREVDGREAPDLGGHDTVVGDLGQLADGSAPAGGRFAGLRRHVATCATCAGTLGVQTRGTALVRGLPMLALPERSRAAMLAAARSRTESDLPSAQQVRAELEAGFEVPGLVDVWVVIVALVAAAVLGLVVGLLLA